MATVIDDCDDFFQIVVHLSPHGPQELSTAIQRSVRSIKEELEQMFGESGSLSEYDLVIKLPLAISPSCPSSLSADELIVLDLNEKVVNYFDILSNPIYVVPSQILIRIQRSLDPTNSLYPPAEFTMTSRHFTVSHIKSEIFKYSRIPPKFQHLVCGGRNLKGDVAVLPIFEKDGTGRCVDIELLVDPRFQTSLPRAKHREPILGLRYMRPVFSRGRYYCERITQEWAKKRL
jgi:hypothetical protein